MKKIFLFITILYLFCSSASAAMFTTNLTCPSTFPIFPQTSVIGQGSPYNYFFVFYSAPSITPLSPTEAIIVNADSSQAAITESNAIMASDLKPAWKQAKSTGSETNGYTEYYCAYISNKYNLSTANPLNIASPMQAADYELYYNGN